MNNLYRFFRYAALMVLMTAWMMPARAQHPFTLTTADDVTNHTETLYWMESYGAAGFYAIPHTNNSNVSTTNMPNLRALWYFMDAGTDNSIQYYYIVNHSTGYYLKLDGENGDEETIKIGEFGSGGDDFMFSVGGSEGEWVFYTKSGEGNYWVNKKGGNVSYDKYLKSNDYGGSPDENSKWNFVERNAVTWAHPFTNSTNEEKHCYIIPNATPNGSAYYLSTDDASAPYATISNVDNNKRVWYFMEADSDHTIPNLKYYYIVNAITGKYLKFTGTANGTSQASSLQLYKHNGTETGETENRFQFMVLNAIGDSYSAYSIMPRLEISYYYNQKTSLSPSNNYSTTLSNDMKIGIYNDRGQNKNYAHWVFEETDFVFVEAPTITDNLDGTVSLSTITPDATIYYTTNGDTPDNTSWEYTSAFPLGDATVIKAIAYLGSAYSTVTTYIVPQGNVDYSQEYLTFHVLTSGEIPWKSIGSGMAKTISYRINGGSWTSITAGNNTISVDAGDVVEFKGSNSTYAKDKSNYSGFDGGTATYDIYGNIMSLIYGDDFVGETTMTGTFNFCSLFKQSKCISAENLILPAATLTPDCYRAMFSLCTTLVTPPQLPATTLAKECYWYMFEACGITTAPDLLAPELVNSCYGHMFVGCTNLNSIKCLATSGINNTNLLQWVGKKNAESTLGVSSTGTFVKAENADWTTVSGTSGIPSGWTVYDDFLLYSPEISCDGEYITITCATPGASIYYRLNQTGEFLPYSSRISITETTFVEAFSSKDDNTSDIVSDTFVIYDNPFDESTRPLDTWTYGNSQVTLPYSVNGIDGHSSNYSKGNHTFETTVSLYKFQPTYLWFQHADQSADIYVDDVFVTTHWGGYNAFFVDITDYVHVGTNRIKVILNNTTRNTLAPAAGDFNFNATLGKVKLLTSPVIPDEFYGYDGFHITSSVTDASATINIKTKIPAGANVICKIDADDENYHFTETKASTGDELTFTTTISNPHLWNGIEDPFLYNVTLEIYHNNELYHRYQRPYGFRYYDYDLSTGFLLNGEAYPLRGVCMHHDLEGKANALDDSDIANDFAIIQELGCNFIRLAHYPHPKEVYDWCDRLGIIVQTEVPCVNKFHSTMPNEYYTHLEMQYDDMVKQHYNHPCIVFWGLGNEITTDDATTAKTRLEGFKTQIKNLDPERWVGYVVSHSISNPSSIFNDPDMDWFGCNIYVGWYINNGTNGTLTNDPTVQLNTRKTNIINDLGKPLAFSEYGCGGTQHCHSEDPQTTTTKGNYARHDIEYQMWLHEGHIAAIKNFPELLFTSQWQLFDIAVSSRNEGYTICLDGENTSTDDNLRYLNNKGLVERDHQTKKDPFYLYKAWWNQTDKFVHICGKDYEKSTNRVIKCYTNDGSELRLFVNNVEIQTATVENNIAIFTATNFNPGDVISVVSDHSSDTFTINGEEYVFTTAGNWNVATNWTPIGEPTATDNVTINAACTIPATYTAQVNHITIGENGSLTIADGGQLYHNREGVTATVQKSISKYIVLQTQGNTKTDGWYLIGSPTTESFSPSSDNGFLSNAYDLYYYHEPTHYWRNYKNGTDNADPGFSIEPLKGYLYANSQNVTLDFQGNLRTGNATVTVPLIYTSTAGSLKGFNLVGNPFAHHVTAYTGTNIADECYRMNGARTDLIVDNISNDNPLNTGEGFFVKATAENASITFNGNTRNEMTKTGRINLEISENNQLIDRLIVKQEGEPLEKLTLYENGTKVFALRDNQEMAVVPMEGNEQAVNFRAGHNGTYTLTVSESLNAIKYLHLIDNLTGADIDLLVEPSYTFSAKATDYASRFRLVFDAESHDDAFAFISNGEIIVTGTGMLQVVDVMGRILISTDKTRTVSTAGMAPGVYVIRLVQGDNVRTQKMVIH